MDYKTLNNGVRIPVLGLGTYKIDNDSVEDVVLKALDIGYRHIDTAAMYGNEEGIGRAIKKSGIPREELFITSKLNNTDQGYDECIDALNESLNKLGLEYLDLYLIHWPSEDSIDSWKAMEKLYEQGKIRAIGLSNFHKKHLDSLLEVAKIEPVVNQYERHPYLQQKELYKLSLEHNMVPEAWSPIAKGKILDDKDLEKIAYKHNKSIPQVVLRWQLQSGYIVFPKTENEDRLSENFDIFDFSLEPEDMSLIESLDKDLRLGTNPDSKNI